MLTKHLPTRSVLALCVLGAGLAFSAQAYAGPDRIYPSSAGWSVNTVSDGNVTNAFSIGGDGSTTLNTDISAGDDVSVSAGWVIQDRSALPGNDTSYSRTVAFSATTSQKPLGAADVAVAPIPNCAVASASSTCLQDIDFEAPATPGNYQVTITLGTGTGSGGPLNADRLFVNFSVAESMVMIDTKLTVDKQCHVLSSGDVNLTARLEETFSGDAIANAQIDFYLDLPSATIGSADTQSDGVATLVYNIDGLGVGDYNLYADYLGGGVYNGSNDSNTLGISYFFAGFRPPINADGTSIFGGRVLPVKIKLLDGNGNPVTDAEPTVWLTSFDKDMGLGENLEETTSVSAADTGNVMRYSPDDEQYIYNWDASDLANGTYAVVVDLGDSAACRAENPYAIITVAKKGGGKK